YRKSIRPDTLDDMTIEHDAGAIREAAALHEGGREYLPFAEGLGTHTLARLSWIKILEGDIPPRRLHLIGQVAIAGALDADGPHYDRPLEPGLPGQRTDYLSARHVAGAGQRALHDLATIIAQGLDAIIEAMQPGHVLPSNDERAGHFSRSHEKTRLGA